MSVIRHWGDDDGATGAYHDGRLSIYAKPSMTRDDGTVAVGIDAPWIEQLAGAVRDRDAVLAIADELVGHVVGSKERAKFMDRLDRHRGQ